MIGSAMDSPLNSEKAFVEAIRQFRNSRAPEVEKEYYESYGDRYSQRIRNELYDRILRLLGKNKNLLIEFADRDAACYNPNTDYFYNRGFADCLRFLRMLKGITDESISFERLLLYADEASYGDDLSYDATRNDKSNKAKKPKFSVVK